MPLAAHALEELPGRTIPVAVVYGLLQQASPFLQLLKPLRGKEKIMLAMLLPRPGRPGGGGYALNQIRLRLQQAGRHRILTRAGGSG